MSQASKVYLSDRIGHNTILIDDSRYHKQFQIPFLDCNLAFLYSDLKDQCMVEMVEMNTSHYQYPGKEKKRKKFMHVIYKSSSIEI